MLVMGRVWYPSNWSSKEKAVCCCAASCCVAAAVAYGDENRGLKAAAAAACWVREGVRGIVWTNSLKLLWSKAIYKVWKCKKSVGNSSSQVKQEHGPVIFSRHGEMLKRTLHSKFKPIIHRGKSVICCKLSLTIEKVKNAAQLVKTCITLRTSEIWL